MKIELEQHQVWDLLDALWVRALGEVGMADDTSADGNLQDARHHIVEAHCAIKSLGAFFWAIEEASDMESRNSSVPPDGSLSQASLGLDGAASDEAANL